MLIYSLLSYIYNVTSRTVGTRTKDCKSAGETRRNEEYRSRRVQASSRKGYNPRRFEENCRKFRKSLEQYQFGIDSKQYGQAWTKTKQVIARISFFLFYNPQFLFTLIYIDTMFMDEMININILQINRMYEILTDKSLIYNGGIG